ncbi:hypothetical protein ACQ4PT_046662 [Festuca glaucescens]
MAARHRRYHIEEPKPTWIVTIKATPPAPARDNSTRKVAAPAYTPPLLLSPSVWQRAQNGKKGRAEGGRDDAGSRGSVPASPRIGCMGQVNGVRRCSSARGPAARRSASEPDYACGSLAGLMAGLFGRRKGRKARAYSKVTDVPSDSSSSGSARGARAPAAARRFDPPLPVPVVRRPAVEENAPSLWERRRGGGMALEGLQLA